MRMFTIPNQSSVPKAWTEFEEDGRMKVRQTITYTVWAEMGHWAKESLHWLNTT